MNKSGDALTGVLTLLNVNTAALPQASSTRGGLLYDIDQETPLYSDGVNWLPIPRNLEDLDNIAIGVPGPTEDGYALTWDNASSTFILSPAPGTDTVTSIDITPATGIVSVGGPITTAGSITVGLVLLLRTPSVQIVLKLAPHVYLQ
jgi:hypothetical protein